LPFYFCLLQQVRAAVYVLSLNALAIFPTEELKMSQEEERQRRATAPFVCACASRSKALTLLILAALLASSCVTSQKDGGVVQNVRSPESTVRAPSPNAESDAETAGYYSNYGSVAKEEERGERYAQIDENPFLEAARAPLSTFSIDVDTASYSNTRRFLYDGQLPPRDAVRIEELVNYFSYDYPQPSGDSPFSVKAEVADCPWNTQHRLVQIGLQGKRISTEDMPPANLVFLVDVSGSMDEPHKLPLVKSGLRTLAEQLSSRDRVAVVTYAGSSGVVLQSTSGDRKSEIIDAVEGLESGGSTNGGSGIKLAYQVAEQNFIRGGVNRVGRLRAGLAHRGEASQRCLALRARLRHGQPQRLDDGEARRQGERQLRLYRLRVGGAQGARRAGRRDAPDHREGR
jgi:hypothetical protein